MSSGQGTLFVLDCLHERGTVRMRADDHLARFEGEQALRAYEDALAMDSRDVAAAAGRVRALHAARTIQVSAICVVSTPSRLPSLAGCPCGPGRGGAWSPR